MQMKLGQTISMVFTPCFIWGQHEPSAYNRIDTGESAVLLEWNKTMVIYKECGGSISESSLRHHMERSLEVVMPHTWGVYVGGGGPETCVVYFPRVLKLVAYPVDGLPVRAHNPGRLR